MFPFLLTRRWQGWLGPSAPLALAAALLAGCASQGDALQRAVPVGAGQLGLPAAAPMPDLPGAWWQALGDPALDALIDQALRDQPDMRQAAARLAQADAALQVQGAARDVHFGVDGSLSREHFSANGIYPPPLGGSWHNLGTLKAGASWEFDYFGRQRAALAAAFGQQQAQAAEMAATRLQLASQISRSWLALGQLQAQRALLQDTLRQREQMLGLIRQRVQAGLDTNVELRQGEGAVPDTRTQIEATDEQIELLRHQLAALAGQGPQALKDATPRLPTGSFTPPMAQLGLDLLAARPEVQAARWRAEAAARRIDVARTEFYPNINLSAFVGLDALGLSELLQGDSRMLGTSAALHLPLFDGKRLRGQLRGREAEYNVAVEQYNAVLLTSARDAADALSSRTSVQRQQAEQAQALRSAESAYDLAQQRYRAGLGGYLLVLNAETQVLAQRRLAVDLQTRLAQSQVALIKSLGGGWRAEATAVSDASSTAPAGAAAGAQ